MPNDTPGNEYEVIAPDGTVGTVSAANRAKVGGGYKLTGRMQMYAPDGTPEFVAPEHFQKAMQAGYQMTPETSFEKQRRGAFVDTAPEDMGRFTTVGHLGNALVDAAKHPRNLLNAAGTTARGIVSGLANLPTNPADAVIAGGKLGAQIGEEDALRKQENRSKAYRATAAIGTAAGIPARQMEEAADLGNPAGVVGAAGASAAATLAPSAIKSARGALLESRAASAPSRGLNLLERSTSPGGMKAEGQLESRLTNQRAAPYLAEQERTTPVVNKQPAMIGSESNPLAGQDMGVMNYRQNAQAAGQRLWSQIAPRAQMYERAPLEATKQGTTASSAIRSTVNPTEAQLNPGKVTGVNSLADFYDKPSTVGEALDRIHELNNDKGVQAYEKATPDKQAELLKGDPTIEGKITAANTLRDQVFDSIEKHGTPEDANWIRNARQDFGAVTEVGKNLGNTQVPTPQPLLTRLMNSARLTLSPTFARESIAKPVSTLFDLNNPNRLALKSSQALGASDLRPPEPPPIRVTPWDPNVRPTGPVVGPQGNPTPFTGKSAGPMITPSQTPVPPTGPGNNVALFPDIPSGQAPSPEHAMGEVPNWPPKVPDWGPLQPPHDTAPATYPNSPTHPDRFAPPTRPPVPSPSGAPAPPAPSASTQSGGPVAAPPPTQPPIPPDVRAPINPQEVIDFERELRGMGYSGPVTADNINALMARANEIRSASTPNNSATDVIAARRKALQPQ